jgi:hypothetical protein
MLMDMKGVVEDMWGMVEDMKGVVEDTKGVVEEVQGSEMVLHHMEEGADLMEGGIMVLVRSSF